MAFEIRAINDIVGTMRANVALGREHYEELVGNKGVVQFDPHLDRYTQLEELGLMVNLGAYIDGQLVGYSTNVLGPHMDSQHLLCGHNTMLFLAKAHRQGLTGMRLIKATSQACKERGARYMLWRARPDTTLAALLPRLGCSLLENVFSEVLE